MRFFEPYIIDTDDVTTDALNSYDGNIFSGVYQGEWSAGSYSDGDVVYKGDTLYESQSDSNTDDPVVGAAAIPPTWLSLGYTNPYRMFNTYVGVANLSGTTASNELNVVLETNTISHVALFNVVADTVTVQILDSLDVVQWEVTYDLLASSLFIDNWYDYFFQPYSVVYRNLFIELGHTTNANEGEKVKIIFTGYPIVFCSNCFVGVAERVGNTLWDPVVKAYSLGSTETDQYGRTSFVSGENYKSVTAQVYPDTGAENYILNQLSKLQNKPVVYDFNNEGTEYDFLLIYGAVTSISQLLESVGKITIDIEVTGIVTQEAT